MPESQAQEQQIAKSWGANASGWTDAVRNGQIASRRLATDDAIVRAVIRHRVRRALDVGCGEGWLARALSERGVEVAGIDGSSLLIERARQLGGGMFLTLSYEKIVADPDALPRASEGAPFDGIICNFALLGKEIAPLIAALRQRRADGGKLFIQTVHPFTVCAGADQPYVDEWRVETFDSFCDGEAFPEPMPWYFRTVGSWIEQVSRAGWRLLECDEPLHPETKRPLSLLLVCG